jgi:hypothetical protein
MLVTIGSPNSCEGDHEPAREARGGGRGRARAGGWRRVLAAVDGSWKVQDGGVSFVGYRVREQLAFLQSPGDAVGRTRAVAGSLRVAGGQLTAASIQADLTQLSSDQSRRDNAIRQQGLQSQEFPMAAFQLVQPIRLPAGLGRG